MRRLQVFISPLLREVIDDILLEEVSMMTSIIERLRRQPSRSDHDKQQNIASSSLLLGKILKNFKVTFRNSIISRLPVYM